MTEMLHYLPGEYRLLHFFQLAEQLCRFYFVRLNHFVFLNGPLLLRPGYPVGLISEYPVEFDHAFLFD